MLGRAHIDLQYTFHPIGKTPAFNVLHDRFRRNPGESDPEVVKAMFLAGGDLRNLMYSLYSESGYEENISWDFTVCDLDPAVLARNILLVALIAHKTPPSSCWNAFYHFYIKAYDLAKIHRYAEDLVSSSGSMEEWASSKYRGLIGILSQDTLHRLRSIWSRYVEVANRGGRDLYNRFREYAKAARREVSYRSLHVETFRTAGVHWKRAVPVLRHCTEAFWETGVVAGNVDGLIDFELESHGHLNPLFAVSSALDEAFYIHPSSDPLLGFHLASCFDDESCPQEKLVDGLVESAKSQFKSWVKCLKRHITARTVHINVFCGDALRFCYELQSIHSPGQNINKLLRGYTAQWSSSLLELEGLDRPEDSKPFDVIDTSTLVDYAGMLNVLPAVTPLLSREVTSVLFTDTIRRTRKDLECTLLNSLGADVTTMSILLGFAPLAHLVGFTTDSSAVEVGRLVSEDSNGKGLDLCYLRIAWKVPDIGGHPRPEIPSCHPIYEEKCICYLYYELYLAMFADQNSYEQARYVARQREPPLSFGLEPYTPQSFITLLNLLKNISDILWPKFLRLIMEKISADGVISAGGNNYQEIITWAYFYDFSRAGPLCVPPREVETYYPIRQPSADSGFLGREELPRVVFPTLIVPREKLKIFTEKDPKEVGTPGIYLSVANLPLKLRQNYFSIQCFFGGLSNFEDGTCDVVADRMGWKGSSDLIVTCAVPTWTLLVGKRKDILISLCIIPCESSAYYSLIIGQALTIFSCGLDGPDLQILRQPANLAFECPRARTNDPPTAVTRARPCLVTLDDERRTVFHSKLAMKGLVEKGLESLKAAQISPCAVKLNHGDQVSLGIRYPFPVEASYKTNLRSDGNVDISVKSAPAVVKGGYDFNPFPVCMKGSRTTTPTIPHVKLDKLPVLSIGTDNKPSWITEMMMWSRSKSEHQLAEKGVSSDETPALMELKDSICTIFGLFVGGNANMRVFDIGGGDGHYVFIFASNIRHTDFQGSVVLDAYVVPFARDRTKGLGLESDVADFARSEEVHRVPLPPKEKYYWKRLLPALVECCRTKWNHKATCEYIFKGRIPVSAEDSYNDVSICSCGEGEDIATFPRLSEWKLFAKYATRIAIPYISMVPYLESHHAITINAPPPKPEPEKCDHCGKGSAVALRRCTRCGKKKYCNHACSKAAWKGHKKECKEDNKKG